ncbi:MAG: NRDE family protein [Burkholderiaceae bacterium]
MCLIVFAWQAHAEYPLIVAANRDEFYARPTASADWWDDGERLAGRDLRAGGTWMGVSKGGRFAALTNYRDPSSQRTDAPSRGALVSDVLGHRGSMRDALDGVSRAAPRYNGFNLRAAQWHRDASRAAMWILSSRGNARPQAIAPGIHALSNASLDTPWPKVDRASRAMQEAMRDGVNAGVHAATDRDDLRAKLFALLGNQEIACDDSLPQTGVALEVERALSAAFIRMPTYGTRSSTLFVVDRTGDALFIERRCEPDVAIEEYRFEFHIAAA